MEKIRIGQPFIVLLLIVSASQLSPCQVPWDNVPPAIRQAFTAKPFGDRYDASDRINPFYLRGDFDGDGKPDYAILVVEVKTRKRGIAVWLSSRNGALVLGAGVPVQYGSAAEDDLDFDHWRVTAHNRFDRSSSVEMPPCFSGDALFVEKAETASGILYFRRGKFLWLQQGD